MTGLLPRVSQHQEGEEEETADVRGGQRSNTNKCWSQMPSALSISRREKPSANEVSSNRAKTLGFGKTDSAGHSLYLFIEAEWEK